MARKTPTISQEELYLQPDEPVREELDDARLLDLDAEEESPFLRGQKRVSVRRGSLPKKTAARLTWAVLGIAVVFLSGIAVASLYHYGERSWRFRVESSDDIEIDVTAHYFHHFRAADVLSAINFDVIARFHSKAPGAFAVVVEGSDRNSGEKNNPDSKSRPGQ